MVFEILTLLAVRGGKAFMDSRGKNTCPYSTDRLASITAQGAPGIPGDPLDPSAASRVAARLEESAAAGHGDAYLGEFDGERMPLAPVDIFDQLRTMIADAGGEPDFQINPNAVNAPTTRPLGAAALPYGAPPKKVVKVRQPSIRRIALAQRIVDAQGGASGGSGGDGGSGGNGGGGDLGLELTLEP